ncbi:MAG: DNA polymerase III subunit chi [Rhodocyclaceae bacterium]|nr:DNA polymerase III subunit chi [Rhodocyclaceae bacterium]MBX3667441.1 DNA polymerase III subunit chi [Rhodocyclaceae bacterium]
MTQVEFHHDAADKHLAACQLVHRHYTAGAKIAVYVPDGETARRFDQLLWTWNALSFIPHVTEDSPLASQTPVILQRGTRGVEGCTVLLNLAPQVPPGIDTYTLLLEVVGREESDRIPARSRVIEYRRLGHNVEMRKFGESK